MAMIQIAVIVMAPGAVTTWYAEAASNKELRD